ncbi:MAG: VWA domain-containing protein [Actinobacteria bacterium]|nr:VWA domain-containing protein [Actinomycetota bacterium]
MTLPLELRHGIPASEPARYRRSERRTTLIRIGLALAMCAALLLAFLVARSQDVRFAPLVPSGTTGMVVLDLSASVSEGGLDATVRKLASTDEKTGLVVFSDGAYELLPPGSPSRELDSLLRYFKERSDGTLPRNPWEEFRGGTRISAGMEFARQVLHRERVTRGSIVLISDLEIDPDEIARLSEVLALIESEGFQVRIVPLFSSDEKRALVERLVGSNAFVRAPEQEELRTPDEGGFGSVAPWLFLLAGGLLVLLLAANERVLPRLEARR